jgi:hypothetical protein
MRGKIVFPFIILAVFVFLLVQGSLNLSTRTMAFPWITGGLGCLLLLWEIVREWRKKGEASGNMSVQKAVSYVPITAVVLSLIPLIYLLGFFIAVPLHVLICLKFNGEKWGISAFLACLMTVIFYGVFYLALGMRFYKGLLFS